MQGLAFAALASAAPLFQLKTTFAEPFVTSAPGHMKHPTFRTLHKRLMMDLRDKPEPACVVLREIVFSNAVVVNILLYISVTHSLSAMKVVLPFLLQTAL